MPVEFILQPTGSSSDTARLTMMYDGSGRRISKTRERKLDDGAWLQEHTTHYTGIGTEVRSMYREGEYSESKVVVNMPQGLGRYSPENVVASTAADTTTTGFEWYFKNHLGSTMLVYGMNGLANPAITDLGETKAAYDYRAFGEQVTFVEPTDKVTENFTGKEKDEEIDLNYFGARYLDPMLGLWISVDAARQYDSPYTYAGNNPIIVTDPDGNLGVGGALIIGAVAIIGYNLLDNTEKCSDWLFTQGPKYGRTTADPELTQEDKKEMGAGAGKCLASTTENVIGLQANGVVSAIATYLQTLQNIVTEKLFDKDALPDNSISDKESLDE